MLECLVSNWQFYTCLIIAAGLSLIPVVGKFLNVLNTLIHESGHAMVALVTGGGVMNIKLSADTSGAAQTKSKYWIGKFLTSLAGYPFSALVAYLFFWLIKNQKTEYLLYSLVSLILINLILWVRNSFGIIWLLVMGTCCTLIIIYGNYELKYFFCSFCSGILLFQSICTTFNLVVISIKTPDKSGDAKNLKEFTFIPSVIWSLLMLLVVVYIALKTIGMFACLEAVSLPYMN